MSKIIRMRFVEAEANDGMRVSALTSSYLWRGIEIDGCFAS